MASVPRLREAGLGVTSQWRDSSEASLKPRAVPDPERWKHLSWVWEGAIRVWAQLPVSSPDIKAHLFSFATASIFQRATNSTFSLLLRPAVCCLLFWWLYFVYSAGEKGESQMCLETAGNVQLHSAIAPHLESSEVKSEEIKHREGKQEKKKKRFGFLWYGELNPSLYLICRNKRREKSIPCLEVILFAVGLYLFFDRGFKIGISLQCETKLRDSLKAQQLELIWTRV